MCLDSKCDICVFIELIGNKTKFHQLCVNNSEKLCPVLLVSCNYKTKCQKNCELLALLDF